MTISRDVARDLFVTGLKNAHATASQGKTMVQAQLNRLENYPEIEAKLHSHLEEKNAQLQRLETILDDLGENTSMIKDATLKTLGLLTSLSDAMAGDEIIKNTFATFALANYEAAAYRTLMVMGEAAGEIDAIAALEQSLMEETAMAAFIAEHLPATGMRFMQLRSQGLQASH
ncbi:MAG: DUF892 family protein [Parvibaculum sp.]|nr:DUF892 family protein [Parvibaculum sp.]